MNEFLANLDMLFDWIIANGSNLVTIATIVGAIVFAFKARREATAKRALMDGLDNLGNVVGSVVDEVNRTGATLPGDVAHATLRTLRRAAASAALKSIDGEAAKRNRLLAKAMAKRKVKV